MKNAYQRFGTLEYTKRMKDTTTQVRLRVYRVAQRFGLPVVPEWAGWFKEELSRRGAISPLVGLGCSPVLVRGTKRMFLKWIGSALRQNRIRFPESNGPVHWTVAHNFFRLSDLEVEELRS